MPIKAVIFDLGDVYLKQKHVFWYKGKHPSIINNERFEEEYKKYTPVLERGEIEEKDFWRNICNNLNIEFSEEYFENFLYEYEKYNLSVDNDVRDVVLSLKSQGFKVAILSNIENPCLEFVKDQGWTDDFDVTVMSCEVGTRKPEEKIYRIVLDELGEKAENCIFIENKPEFIKAAKNLGIKTILFDNSKNDIGYLKKKLSMCGIKV